MLPELASGLSRRDIEGHADAVESVLELPEALNIEIVRREYRLELSDLPDSSRETNFCPRHIWLELPWLAYRRASTEKRKLEDAALQRLMVHTMR